jgi:DNA-binding NtrC family response regulator
MSPKQPTKILIVEDDIITATAIEKSLKKAGYQVAGIMVSAEEATKSASATKPDLVLMDIRLKGSMDGITAAQRIQALLGIPVIYLTAHSDPETLKRVLHSKAYGYITKPFTSEHLHETIEQAMEWHKTKRIGD